MLDKTTIEDSIREAFHVWDYPSIPEPGFYHETEFEDSYFDNIRDDFAFMNYPSYKIYFNLDKIASSFDDPRKAFKGIAKHEFGHRYVPYDAVTSTILKHFIIKSLRHDVQPYSIPYEAILNLFTDLCINTNLVKNGDKDIVYIYQQFSKQPANDLWKIYARVMEKIWDIDILPKNIKLNHQLEIKAQTISNIFRENILDREKWPNKINEFAKEIHKFIDYDLIYSIPLIDNISSGAIKSMSDDMMKELVKRFKNDINSLNTKNMADLLEMMSDEADTLDKLRLASIRFYDMASDYYTVRFAKKSFSGSKEGKFQPIKWHPSSGAEKLDIEYSTISGGIIIPSITTYMWKKRNRNNKKTMEDMLDLDLYIDSSASMPDPVTEVSLPVLAGFVVSKMAHKKGVSTSITNFSENFDTQEPTRELNKIFEKLVMYYGGETVFPVSELENKKNKRLILIITDTFLANLESTVDSIKYLTKKGNLVSIYAISNCAYKQEFEMAGAQVIQGTTTNIFREIVGKTFEVYENA